MRSSLYPFQSSRFRDGQADLDSVASASAPTTVILSHSQVPTEFTRDSTLTKSGAVLTLGPYFNIPAKTEIGPAFEIHYKYDGPVIALRKLKRAVEVSF